MSDLSKKDNETKLKYIERLVYGKLVDKSIDEDYVELAPLIFEQELSSTECRKRAYGVKYVLDIIGDEQLNNVEDEDVLDEIELKRIELQQERNKKQTIMVEYNKMLRENARTDLLFEELKKSIEKVSVPEFNPIVKEGNKNRQGVLAFGDEHFGKIFTSLDNTYSEDEYYNRMNKLTSEILEVCKEQGLSHIHIINLGDNIEGMCLRVSQLKSLQMGITDMVIRYSRYMVNFLNTLSKYITITYHHSATGNHSQIRPLGTKADQFPKENLERVIFMYLKDMLANNERIEIPEYEDGTIFFNIFDYNIVGKHKVKGIDNALAKMSLQYRKFIDTLYLGHLHHKEVKTIMSGKTNNCEIVLVPSIMGNDDYSDELLTGSKAGVLFDVYEENKGRRITYNIILN